MPLLAQQHRGSMRLAYLAHSPARSCQTLLKTLVQYSAPADVGDEGGGR
jgi:hypothetical protein